MKSTTQIFKDLKKVMRELMAIQRYWEFKESISYENADWNNAEFFLNNYVGISSSPMDAPNEHYDEETMQLSTIQDMLRVLNLHRKCYLTDLMKLTM